MGRPEVVHLSHAASSFDRRRLWNDSDIPISGRWREDRVLGIQTLPLIQVVSYRFICNWPSIRPVHARQHAVSADNGIYILKTAGPEYRVAHLQGVENVDWHVCSIHGTDMHFGNDGRPNCEECHTGYCNDPECRIINAREMWRDCEALTDESKAVALADQLYHDCTIVEYGVCYVEIDRPFEVRRAKRSKTASRRAR